MSVRLLIFPAITATLLFSCEKDDPESTVWPELNIYLQRFEQEAQKRGYDLDLSAVEAVYVDEIKFNDGSTPCGAGYWNYDGNGTRRIEISKAGYCNWVGRSDIEMQASSPAKELPLPSEHIMRL